MNMSHVISHFSFGRMIAPKVMSDVKRLVPYLGGSHDRLNGRSFINHRDLGANVTVSLSLYTSWHCVCFSIVLCLYISISMFKWNQQYIAACPWFLGVWILVHWDGWHTQYIMFHSRISLWFKYFLNDPCICPCSFELLNMFTLSEWSYFIMLAYKFTNNIQNCPFYCIDLLPP